MSKYIISTENKDPLLIQQLNRIFTDLDSRIAELEYKSNKSGKKIDITRAEKSAILFELGVFDFLLSKKIPQKKIAALLGLIYNASPSNIEKDLSLKFNDDAPFKTKESYKMLVSTFKDLQLSELEKKSQETLNTLEKKI